MRILLSGVTGFLGGHLAARFVGDGHDVVGLSRQAAAARERVPGLSAAFDWDPLAGPPPAAALEGVDAVVHLAGEPVTGRWTKRKRAAIMDSRAQGTAHLVEALTAPGREPGVLVSASAIGFYGDRGDEELDEQAAVGEGFMSEVCQAWEAAAAPAAEAGWRLVQPRFGLVLGLEGGALPAMLPTFKRGLGGRLGSGRQWWSWIHVDDLVGIVRHAVQNELSGAVNAVAPAPLRQRAVATALAKQLGRGTFLPAPGFALRLVLGGFASELLGSTRCLPRAADAAGYTFRFPELESALADLL